MDYTGVAVVRRSDDELKHYKYISREKKYGRWVYKYPSVMTREERKAKAEIEKDERKLHDEYSDVRELSLKEYRNATDEERKEYDRRSDEYDSKYKPIADRYQKLHDEIEKRIDKTAKTNRLSEASVSKGNTYVKRALK